ncbi:hypothetical protein GCM10028798_25790 [Humibacter antri]
MFGFTTIPLVAFVAPLLVLPIVARVGGVDGWASVGIGQSLGAFGVYTTSFGWNAIGAARVALEKDENRRKLVFAQSLWTRGVAFAVTSIVLGSIAFAISADGYRWVGALVAVATALGGMTVSWYGVGVSKPSLVMRYETIPITVAMILAAVAILLTGQIILYPVFMGLATMIGIYLMCRSLFRESSFPPAATLGLGGVFRRNAGPAVIDASGGAYSSAPVPIARATTGLAGVAGLVSADRVYRFGLTAVVVVGNALQGWVLECAPAEGRYRRQIASIAAHLGLGLVGGGVLAIGGPWIAMLLFGGSVVPSEPVFFWYGVAYLSISVATPFIRNLLIPGNKTGVVVIATVLSALIGIGAMVVLGLVLGLVGVAMALAISELVVTCILAVPAFQLLRDERSQFVRRGGR